MKRFPHYAIARNIVVNAVVIWLGLRFGAMVVGWGLATSIPLAVFIVVLTSALTLFNVRRRSRHLLLENLGVSRLPVGVIAAFPPLVFESVWLWISLA
jgi:hypothetical protein